MARLQVRFYVVSNTGPISRHVFRRIPPDDSGENPEGHCSDSCQVTSKFPAPSARTVRDIGNPLSAEAEASTLSAARRSAHVPTGPASGGTARAWSDMGGIATAFVTLYDLVSFEALKQPIAVQLGASQDGRRASQ